MENNTTQKPFISFCMSTYNRPVFLETQLTSLLKQSYTNFEIIISDNDVAQSAKNVANSFLDKRIKYFANEENLGMIKSFNKSVGRSSGEFIIMITDDDPLYFETLQTLVDLSNQFPLYGVYAGCGDWIIANQYAVDTQKMPVGTHAKLSPYLNDKEVVLIEKENFIYEYIAGKLSKSFLLWSCAMVRRNVLLKVNGIPDYGSEFLGDHAYIITVSSQLGMVYKNTSLGGQLVHGANFGYDFYKVINKYINTPTLFYNYLKLNLSHLSTWEKNVPILWNYIGRGWVEYSLMLFHSLKHSKKTKVDFYKAFNQAFSLKEIKMWKYKFYIKAYSNNLFKLLLKLKSI